MFSFNLSTHGRTVNGGAGACPNGKPGPGPPRRGFGVYTKAVGRPAAVGPPRAPGVVASMAGNEPLRRPGFVPGVEVRLADGDLWALPARDASRADPEYDALLAAVDGSETRDDALRAGLALTIFLIGRNYDLSPDRIAALLTFEPGDRALAALQDAVDALVAASTPGRLPFPPGPGGARPDPDAGAGGPSRLFKLWAARTFEAT